jgi:hypothetical protein
MQIDNSPADPTVLAGPREDSIFAEARPVIERDAEATPSTDGATQRTSRWGAFAPIINVFGIWKNGGANAGADGIKLTRERYSTSRFRWHPRAKPPPTTLPSPAGTGGTLPTTIPSG